MAQIDEKILWGAAEKLRDKCDPADYKNVVLGLVFLKYVSDKFVSKYKELKEVGDGREDDEDYYIQDHVFIVPHEALWSEVAKHSKQEDLGQVIDNAFILLERNNNQLKGILPKTYSKSDLDKNALGELVDFFTNNLTWKMLMVISLDRCMNITLVLLQNTYLQKAANFLRRNQ